MIRMMSFTLSIECGPSILPNSSTAILGIILQLVGKRLTTIHWQRTQTSSLIAGRQMSATYLLV
jgi:hypothetical protein